ncbi:hypothetical protein VP01_462g1 [Puccinia sorghi]|uniref:Uncharacterized protein n=1 Tax=Puccinia sorghi TaxID=27349 RepID=A0A0L6UP66_9BASI|nr:hypothetical protein VP01_462g1 [Puccinia sorghi]
MPTSLPSLVTEILEPTSLLMTFKHIYIYTLSNRTENSSTLITRPTFITEGYRCKTFSLNDCYKFFVFLLYISNLSRRSTSISSTTLLTDTRSHIYQPGGYTAPITRLVSIRIWFALYGKMVRNNIYMWIAVCTKSQDKGLLFFCTCHALFHFCLLVNNLSQNPTSFSSVKNLDNTFEKGHAQGRQFQEALKKERNANMHVAATETKITLHFLYKKIVWQTFLSRSHSSMLLSYHPVQPLVSSGECCSIYLYNVCINHDNYDFFLTNIGSQFEIASKHTITSGMFLLYKMEVIVHVAEKEGGEPLIMLLVFRINIQDQSPGPINDHQMTSDIRLLN